jgi:hypothetical protein
MTRVLLAGLCVAVMAATGCGPMRGGAPDPVDRVDAIELWANPPAAINWDDVPGLDGVRVNVFLYQAARAQPVLVKGTLEFLMFDGRVQQAAMASAKPLLTWSYDDQELATRQFRQTIGWGYAAQLGWGSRLPTANAVTLVACYKPLKGPAIFSVPLLIEVSK